MCQKLVLVFLENLPVDKAKSLVGNARPMQSTRAALCVPQAVTANTSMRQPRRSGMIPRTRHHDLFLSRTASCASSTFSGRQREKPRQEGAYEQRGRSYERSPCNDSVTKAVKKTCRCASTRCFPDSTPFALRSMCGRIALAMQGPLGGESS